MIPVFTGTTVLMVALFFISLPFLVIVMWTAFFTRLFKDVKGFENYGKVCEGITSFIVQGSKREKLFATALTLTIILACLFLSLWFLSGLGILTVNFRFSTLLGLLFVGNYLVALYFGFRIERALKKYVEMVRT